MLRIIAISLPNCNSPHIIRTYLCSVLAIEMLQPCRLSTNLHNTKRLKHKYRSQSDLLCTWPNYFLTCHSLRFAPLTHFISTVKSNLHFRHSNTIITQKFQPISFFKATGNCIMTIHSFWHSKIQLLHLTDSSINL